MMSTLIFLEVKYQLRCMRDILTATAKSSILAVQNNLQQGGIP